MKKLLNSINKINALMDRKQAVIANARKSLADSQADLKAANERKQQAVHDTDEAAYNQAEADIKKATMKVEMWEAQIKHYTEEPYITAEEYAELKNEIISNYRAVVEEDKAMLVDTFVKSDLLNSLYDKEQQASNKTLEALVNLRDEVYCDPELKKYASNKRVVSLTEARTVMDYETVNAIDSIRSAVSVLK